jgi:CRP-like cAMP-binding protein
VATSETNHNRILAGLSDVDRRLLEPITKLDLPVRTPLEQRNKRIDKIYFLDSGIASVVANGLAGRAIEVGIIGREGTTGITVILGDERPPHETFMQVGGRGQWVDANVLRRAMNASSSLRRALLQACHGFLVQTSYTALANGRAKVEQRLSRWLLLAQDRVDESALSLTHEFLAMMLGVRRPGVTESLHILERKGLIRRGRAAIEILDRPGLIKLSAGTYHPVAKPGS